VSTVEKMFARLSELDDRLIAEITRLRTENAALRNAAHLAQTALTNMSDVYVGDDDDVGECASCHERSYRGHAPDCERTQALLALALALRQQDRAG
jgi:hypothetical protein